jgi:hypothetical protein
LFLGGGEDRYGRGGLSEGRLSCRQPRVQGGVGGPGFEHPGLPASRSCVTPVSVRFAVSGWAGDGPTGSQLPGVVQIRGGSVIFGP